MKYLLWLLTFIPFCSYSQYKVTGVVKDTLGFIPYANVVVFQRTNEIIKGTITDENGVFTLNLENGTYKLVVSYVGYKNYETIIEVEKDIALGGIVLIEDLIMLEEIIIEGRKLIIEYIADKLIFNVESSTVRSGFDGVEVLKRAPGVFIDGKENILIQNKPATVLINGRKLNLARDELANYIKSIDASNIKMIEIQSNATSEMDANVQAGTINIILKKKKTGLFAQVKAYQMQKGKYPNFYSSGNINYGTVQWNIYSTISFDDTKDSGTVRSSTIYNNTDRLVQENSSFFENSRRYSFTIGTTYQPFEKHELGFELYTTTKNRNNKTNSQIDIYNNSKLLDKGLTNAPRNRNSKYFNTSINYSYKIDTLGSKISFIGDYATQDFYSDFNAATTYQQAYYDDSSERSKTDASTSILSAQIDFNKTTQKKGDISSGIKITTTSRNNKTIGENIIDGRYETIKERTNAYDFTENIFSAYFMFSRKIIYDINIRFGLRVENSTIKGKNLLNHSPVSQNYFDCFPSVSLSKELKNKHSVSFNYNKKIDRPAFSLLNPYVIKINDFIYQTGNPNLRPQYRNNFEVTYNLNYHFFSIFYKQTSNLMTGIYFPIDDAVYYQYQNIGKSKTVGFEYSLGENVKEWWYLKIGSTILNQNYILTDKNNHYNTISFYLNNDWIISDTWSASLSAYYISPRTYGYLEVADYLSSNFMIQKTFFQKNLKVRIYIDDIFNTVRDKNSGFYNDFTYNFYQKRNSQSFALYAVFTLNTNNLARKNKNKSSNQHINRL